MTNDTASQDDYAASFDARMAAEKAAAKTAARALRTYAGQIAAALGAGWSLAPSRMDADEIDRWPMIQHTDGPTFSIGRSWNQKGKISVSCEWPKNAAGQPNAPYFSQYSSNGSSAPGISFSAEKAPAVAAKDIARRFLPAFLPMWTAQAEQVSSRDAYADRRLELATRVAALMGGTVTTDQNGRTDQPADVRMPYREDPHVLAGLTIANDTQIDVKLRLDFAQLEQLAAFLKTL